jgi:hypothetical protein
MAGFAEIRSKPPKEAQISENARIFLQKKADAHDPCCIRFCV